MPKKEAAETEIKAPKETKKKKANLKVTGRGVILGALIVVFAFLTTVGVLIYNYQNESAFVKGVSRVVPYPIVMADGKVVTAYDFIDQMDILKNYYKEFKKVDFNSEDGKKKLNDLRKDVIDRLTEDAIIEKEAKEMNVTVPKKELDESFDKLVVSNGGQKDFADILNKYYGLSIDEFKEKIYKPRVLREKMTEKINSEETNTGASKKKADEVLAKAKAGEDFAKLARENSGDPGTAANGGDLGYFGKGKMVPEFEEAAFKLKVGEISEPIRTVYGYHIIKLTDKKGDEVKASHILVKVRDFNEWLAEKKDELKSKKGLGGIVEFYKIKQ